MFAFFKAILLICNSKGYIISFAITQNSSTGKLMGSQIIKSDFAKKIDEKFPFPKFSIFRFNSAYCKNRFSVAIPYKIHCNF